MTGFSPRYDAALALAARAHRDQVRKSTDLPYITHVVHVSVILIHHGFGEDLAIAGLLHDVVEDCDVPLAAIAAVSAPMPTGIMLLSIRPESSSDTRSPALPAPADVCTPKISVSTPFTRRRNFFAAMVALLQVKTMGGWTSTRMRVGASA